MTETERWNNLNHSKCMHRHLAFIDALDYDEERPYGTVINFMYTCRHLREKAAGYEPPSNESYLRGLLRRCWDSGSFDQLGAYRTSKHVYILDNRF